MPTVNLTQATYEKLQKLAARAGRTPDAQAEQLLLGHLRVPESDSWRDEFRGVREEIQAGIPADVTEDQLQAEINEAIDAVRAGRRASRR